MPGLCDGILAIDRFAADFDIGSSAQDRPNAPAHQFMIVGD